MRSIIGWRRGVQHFAHLSRVATGFRLRGRRARRAEREDVIVNRTPAAEEPTSPGKTTTVAIIGAGFSGICLAIRLKQAGIETFTIFEKSDGVGGTWRDNSYPGAACDVPSFLYSFSFEVKTRLVAQVQPASRRSSSTSSTAPTSTACDPTFASRPRSPPPASTRTRGCGASEPPRGDEHTANVLVSGVGQLNRPYYPDIAGAGRLPGHVLPFGALEPRARSLGRERRRHRQRRQRRPDHPADRAADGAALRLPAQRQLDAAAHGRGVQRERAQAADPRIPCWRASIGRRSGHVWKPAGRRSPRTAGWAGSCRGSPARR